MLTKRRIKQENMLIVDVNARNITEHPEVICFINPKHPSYPLKVRWLRKRFGEGLKIKLLCGKNEKRCFGFIEYMPGEFAWRAVEAKDYLFIHCLWIYKNSNKNKGFGSLLVGECIKDAVEGGKKGVAVIASDGPFIAGREIFLKNGFRMIETSGSYGLLVRQIKKSNLPKFSDREAELNRYRGWHVIYSLQCPWAARSTGEMKKVSDRRGIKIRFRELKTARQAQRAPSAYGVFTLLHDGKILADHYISPRRFGNILDKETARMKT